MIILGMFSPLIFSLNSLTGYSAEYNGTENVPTTGFEDSNGEEWTTYEKELQFLEEVAVKSDRLKYTVIGASAEGRPLHLIRVGYPEPPPDEEIANARNILIMGTQHGNEPSGREMAMKLMRDLAFTDDPELQDLLNRSTVLFIPTVNPDGREADRRVSTEGVDLNRDQLELETPEGRTIAKVLNQFQPDIILDAHERVSGPNISLLWPTNLNVDEELRELNKEAVMGYMIPDIEDTGLTTELYPGSGSGRTVRNITGLRHRLGILAEATWVDDPVVRVKGQMCAATSVLRFYLERFDDIEKVITEAPDRKEDEGMNQSEPYYLEGDVDTVPPESDILDPPPCGYLLNKQQIKEINRQIELFSLEIEQVSENGVFVTMAQPMMTIIPLLLDERSNYSVVDGLALYDPSIDPGLVDPPALPEPVQYSNDFSQYEFGSPPVDWLTLWRESGWTVLEEPKRLEHVVTEGGGRRVLTWDEVGKVRNDVEVSGLVRARGDGTTMFQIHLHGSGNAGSESSYYLDILSQNAGSSANHVRINRNLNSRFRVLETSKLPFNVEENIWYQVVFQREGEMLRGKVWPYGEDEADFWQVIVGDRFIDRGRVGVGHVSTDMVNEWAFFGVGTAGDSAPRPPEDFLPEVDKTLLQNRVDEINAKNLIESDFTKESWIALENALVNTENVLIDPETTQVEVDTALVTLNEAYNGLVNAPAQYYTGFREYTIGETPYDWTQLWRENTWTVKNNPSRLELSIDSDDGGRRALAWKAVTEILGGAVEVATVVRADNIANTMFQLGLSMSGGASSENAYYLDTFHKDSSLGANMLRINRFMHGGFRVLGSVTLPFDMIEGIWYHAVLQQDGDKLKAKVWPYGENEPSDWELVVQDDALNTGGVGVAHLTRGVINDWAFFSVGVGGESAPRAPENLFDPVDYSSLEALVGEINAENLNSERYTEESWEALHSALIASENIIKDLYATQAKVDALYNRLNEAYTELQLINIDYLNEKLEGFVASGELGGPLKVQLTNRLDQAEHQFNLGHYAQAIKKLEDFKKHLNNEALEGHISDNAKESLLENASRLIDLWSEK